jgi:hypothetical protein
MNLSLGHSLAIGSSWALGHMFGYRVLHFSLNPSLLCEVLFQKVIVGVDVAAHNFQVQRIARAIQFQPQSTTYEFQSYKHG